LLLSFLFFEFLSPFQHTQTLVFTKNTQKKYDAKIEKIQQDGNPVVFFVADSLAKIKNYCVFLGKTLTIPIFKKTEEGRVDAMLDMTIGHSQFGFVPYNLLELVSSTEN
jgi:hypothetical protein